MNENDRTGIHQYLTFKLAEERYAINVAYIKEVLSVPRITKVPRMPEYKSGVINLRGSVVPVVDLCKKFDLGETTRGVDTGIIVIEILQNREEDDERVLTVGVFSDAVEKVITIEEAEIEPAPRIGVAIDTAFIRGMGHVGDEFIIILNINRILTGTEIETLQGEIQEVAYDEKEEAAVEETATPETVTEDNPAE
ncbi:MAG: chemotaxis protein CheW [Treponema sp.]|nr:chemotaxis protein CheW [Treponema sp.]